MKTAFVLFLFIFLGLLSGCEKPDPAPHLSDYIYQDISAKLSEATADVAASKSNIADLEKQLQSADKLSSDIKKLRQKLKAAKAMALKAEQMVLFYKMRLLSRESYVKERYLEAYMEGKKWDSSEETERYKAADPHGGTKGGGTTTSGH